MTWGYLYLDEVLFEANVFAAVPLRRLYVNDFKIG